MKKNWFTKLICGVLASSCVFSIAACNNNASASEKELLPTGEDKEVVKDESGNETYLVSKGKSEYQIVIPETATKYLKLAAEELQNYLKASTGAKLQIITDTDLPNGDDTYISLGNTTQFAQTNLAVTKEELGESGFKVLTKDKAIYIGGYSVEGVLYGVFDLLETLINMEVYSIDEIVYDQKTQIPLYDLNYTERPLIDYAILESRYFCDYTTAYPMRLKGGWGMSTITTDGKVYGTWCHSFPDIGITMEAYPQYFSNGQLCMTNPEVIDLVASKLIGEMKKKPDCTYYQLGHSDFSGKCSCSACAESEAQNGGVGGTYVIFLNKIAEKVEQMKKEEGLTQETFIEGLAYLSYASAPTYYDEATGTYKPVNENVMCRDDVTIMYAPITACHFHAYNDPNCETNQEFGHYDSYMGWATVTKNHFKVWSYNTEFGRYGIPFNDWGSYVGDFKLYAETGVYHVFLQANSQNQRASFDAFRAYLVSKLSWDATDSFDEMFNDFFDGYYKEASPYMKEYYYALQGHYLNLYEKYGSNGCGGYDSMGGYDYRAWENWPYQLLQSYKAIFKKAYAAIEASAYSAEKKEQLRQRILLEETYIDILIHEEYLSYEANPELFTASLIENTNLLGIVKRSEGGVLEWN